MNRYVITYFSDPTEGDDSLQELKTIFIKGLSVDDARNRFHIKFGAFAQIMSCDLTKSCGGPGLTENTETITIGKNVTYDSIELEEVTPGVLREVLPKTEPELKKIKVVNRGGKVSNASLIRQKIAEAKEAGQDKNFVVDWAVTTLGQTRPVAKSYVKNIWAE